MSPLGRVLTSPVGFRRRRGRAGDIKTVTMLGGYAATAITAVTVQNTLGVTGAFPMPPTFIAAQAQACWTHRGDVIKTGMLGRRRGGGDVVAACWTGWLCRGDRSGDGGQGRRAACWLTTPSRPEDSAGPSRGSAHPNAPEARR